MREVSYNLAKNVGCTGPDAWYAGVHIADDGVTIKVAARGETKDDAAAKLTMLLQRVRGEIDAAIANSAS